MLKAYVMGLLGGTAAVLLVAVIWFGPREQQQAGLLWGDKVYTSKQEFNGYLKSKGLSYDTWLARNPGVAPWEPGEITVGAITVRASMKARDDWVVRLPFAALGLMAATMCVLLGLRRLRIVVPGLPTRSVAFVSAVLTVLLVAVAVWIGKQPTREPGLVWGDRVYTSKQEFKGYLKSKALNYDAWVARNPGAAPWESTRARSSSDQRVGWLARLLLAALGLMVGVASALLLLRRWRPAMPNVTRGSVMFLSAPTRGISKASAATPTAFALIRRITVVATTAARPLTASAPLYVERLGDVARVPRRLLSQLMRERNIRRGDVGFGVLAVVTAVMSALFVVFLLSL